MIKTIASGTALVAALLALNAGSVHARLSAGGHRDTSKLPVADAHPTLPNYWVSETNEPDVGVGIEAYKFVSEPTPANPSAMWSNYSGCQRLIWIPDEGGARRYLLGCDAVDCCYESQDGNQVYYQIPNSKYSTVYSEGKKTITTKFGTKVTADVWYWTDLYLVDYYIYTTPCPSCANNVTLWRWDVHVFREGDFTLDFNDFKGYTPGTPAAQKFLEQFSGGIPQQCRAPNTPNCNGLRDEGKLKTAWKEPAVMQLQRVLKQISNKV